VVEIYRSGVGRDSGFLKKFGLIKAWNQKKKLAFSRARGFPMTLPPSHSMLNGKRREFRKIGLSSKISSVILLILLFSPSIGSPRSSSVGEAKFLSPLENAVVDEINMARTAPKNYASLLERYKKYYDKKLLKLPGETPILTKEGVGGVIEAVRYLRSVKPVLPLNASKGMSLGARDHVKDQGASGSTQHKGSDGSQVWDRVNRYGTWERSIAENIACGDDKARNIVAFLIVDDGVSNRGHRKDIFNPDFRVIGVAFGRHRTYRTICVITFAGGYKERSGK
jgi:uncharacterized protein YkwD